MSEAAKLVMMDKEKAEGTQQLTAKSHLQSGEGEVKAIVDKQQELELELTIFPCCSPC